MTDLGGAMANASDLTRTAEEQWKNVERLLEISEGRTRGPISVPVLEDVARRSMERAESMNGSATSLKKTLVRVIEAMERVDRSEEDHPREDHPTLVPAE